MVLYSHLADARLAYLKLRKECHSVLHKLKTFKAFELYAKSEIH